MESASMLAPTLETAALEAAVRTNWAPILKGVGLPQIAGDAPTESVMLAVQALARDPLCLSRGELLTTIERFGTAWSNVLLQYICQGKPYNGRETAIDIWSTLRNVGDRPVNVITRVRIKPVKNLRGNITSDGWSTVSETHHETIELVAERAIHMLRRESWEARTAAEQATTSRPKMDHKLREVGYRVEWVDYETGEKSSVSSAEVEPEVPRRKRASA